MLFPRGNEMFGPLEEVVEQDAAEEGAQQIHGLFAVEDSQTLGNISYMVHLEVGIRSLCELSLTVAILQRKFQGAWD